METATKTNRDQVHQTTDSQWWYGERKVESQQIGLALADSDDASQADMDVSDLAASIKIRIEDVEKSLRDLKNSFRATQPWHEVAAELPRSLSTGEAAAFELAGFRAAAERLGAIKNGTHPAIWHAACEIAFRQ
jgi:hypothetical protein